MNTTTQTETATAPKKTRRVKSMRDRAQAWFDATFHCINLDVLKRAFNNDENCEFIEWTTRYDEDEAREYGIDDDNNGWEDTEDDNGDDVRVLRTTMTVPLDPMWGFGFIVRENVERGILKDEDFIECGYCFTDLDDVGRVLGVNGCGYDFYDAHHTPLYKRWMARRRQLRAEWKRGIYR